MNFFQLKSVLAETGLSPEQIAPKLGLSNMTIRRWRTEPNHKLIPTLYERSVIEGIYQFLIEGTLKSDSEAVQAAISSTPSLSFQAVLTTLGVSEDLLNSGSCQEDKMAIALYQIGANEDRKMEVNKSTALLHSLKKMGQEWTKRISLLMEIVQSVNFSRVDKLIAYGALFYLICPFDLIPDQIPVVGYVDDFGILGLAVAYYIRKFPELNKGQNIHATHANLTI